MYFLADHLRVCSDAHFQLEAAGNFPFNGFLHCIQQGLLNALSVKSSPLHILFFLSEQ
jgi:hypothetical protein